SDQLLENKRKMIYHLQDEKVAHQEVNEPLKVYSIGFAEQTIAYAKESGADALAIMASASDEYRYMADAEKERMLTNDAHLPVICCP
ncbi:MAG: hypothetical protein KDB88_04040, partial [Flavobacteriales bacterium]|nr:hypothetical protein [Flavobacteriales bacterium]